MPPAGAPSGDDDSGGRDLGVLAVAAAAACLRVGAETGERPGERPEGQRQPEQTVPEQVADDGRDLPVLLGDRPVADLQLEGGAAERIEAGGERLAIGISTRNTPATK